MTGTPSHDWVFFDVGNVLLVEARWLAVYEDMTFGLLREIAPSLERADFDAEAWQCSTAHDTPAATRLLRRAEPEADLPAGFWDPVIRAYFDLGEPPASAFDVLADLSRDHRLGVIGNQHPLVHVWMRRTGLDRWFRVQAFDCDLGFAKPDPRLYTAALERAGCPPERAVMVGDRLDYDVRPARAVGMRAIRVRAGGRYTGGEPADALETPDAEVRCFAALPEAVRRLARAPQTRRP